MPNLRAFVALFCFTGLLIGCQSGQPRTERRAAAPRTNDWALLPFVKVDSVNPILHPDARTSFACPVRRQRVYWEAQDVYNPAAVVRNGQVMLLYRAEDTTKAVNGTSRLGLAISADGIHFVREPEPVFFPAEDALKKYEWMGGCEDPRLVEDAAGVYWLTYTAYDGQTARLCVASSPDLRRWTKHGLAFKAPKDANLWSKSGSIVCQLTNDRLVATKIRGQYWMYWGENGLVATSPDLISWTYLADSTGAPRPVVPRRADQARFDNALVEPGPPALLTDRGILFIYNGAAASLTKPGNIETYAGGQALLDKNDPTRLLARLDTPFIRPEKPYELAGQVNKVTFVEGLVHFNNRWFLYYGTADSKIAVAVSESAINLAK